MEFIDKMESNSLWIKWMKVRWFCVQVQEAAPDAVHTQLPKFETPICDKKVHITLSQTFLMVCWKVVGS